jgi:hypothetical protein
MVLRQVLVLSCMQQLVLLRTPWFDFYCASCHFLILLYAVVNAVQACNWMWHCALCTMQLHC